MKNLFLFFIVFLPTCAFAENNFSITIPEQFVDTLNGNSLNTSSINTLSIPTSKGSKNIILSPVEIRSANYQSYISTESGRVKDNTEVKLFKGVATGEAATNFEFYRFALINDGQSKPYFDGYYYAEGTFYSLKRENTGAEYLVTSMTDADFQKLAASCGAEHSDHVNFANLTSSQANITALKTIQMATEADYEYFTQEGSSGNANATILSILNGVDAIYRAQLNLTISVVFQNVWTTPSDPYSSTVPITLLNQFVDHWQSTFNSSYTYDLAHLFTGRDLDGGVVGVAYISGVCGSFKYGLSQRLTTSSYIVPLTAHEVGHNMGSNHDTCTSGEQFLMCPTLVANSNTFSTASVNAIANISNSATCLSTGGGNPTPTPTPTPSPTPTPNPGNNPPVLTPIGSKTARENQNLNINLSATDPNGDALTYGITYTPYGFLTGTSYNFFADTGTIPSGSNSLSFNVTFTVSDGRGGIDSETIVITLFRQAAPNQPPVFNNPGTQAFGEGQLLNLTLSATDPEGTPVTINITSALPLGASYDSQSKLFSWRPLGNQSGTYTINVSVADQAGLTVTGSFNIIVSDEPGVPNVPPRHNLGDFDGDGAAELALFRNYSAEWFTKNYSSSAYSTTQFGLSGDLPVPGDYNGDRISDFAVFRPSTNTWYVLPGGGQPYFEVQFGSTGDIPVKGADYDGDGRDEIAVFRPAIGSYVYRSINGSENYVTIGAKGDIPMPCDYNGDGKDDVTVYRPSTGSWISSINGSNVNFTLGGNNDVPLSGDLNGDGRCERIVYSSGLWIGETGVLDSFGTGSDVPTIADYNADGIDDLGLWKPTQATWHLNINSWSPIQFGLFRDVAALEVSKIYAMKNSRRSGVVGRGTGLDRAFVYQSRNRALFSIYAGGVTSRRQTIAKGTFVFRGDYDGDTQLDNVYYYRGRWTIHFARGVVAGLSWGLATDIPVSGDFDGDSVYDAAVFRSGEWHVLSSLTGQPVVYNVGGSGDVPVAADYNGDGRTDPAVVNRGTMIWQAVDARSNTQLLSDQWGIAGDVPVVADFDADGRADIVAYRPANGTWYIKMSGGNELFVAWGGRGDVPIAGSFFSANAVDIAIFRPSTGRLAVRSLLGRTATFGSSSARNGQIVDLSVPQSIR